MAIRPGMKRLPGSASDAHRRGSGLIGVAGGAQADHQQTPLGAVLGSRDAFGERFRVASPPASSLNKSCCS